MQFSCDYCLQSNKLVFANFNAKQWVRVTSYPPVTKMPAYRGSPRKRRVSDDFAPSAERKKVKLKAKRALRTSRNDANTLERLIPTPTDFEGLNQPFLLEVERSNMKLRSLWQQFGVHVCSNKAVLLEALAPSAAELQHHADDADADDGQDVDDQKNSEEAAAPCDSEKSASQENSNNEERVGAKKRKRARSQRFEPTLPEGAPPIKYDPYLVFGQRERSGQLEYIMSWHSPQL